MRFNQSFFPHCSIHWNNLPESIKNCLLSPNLKTMIQPIRPKKKSIFGIRDKYGLALLTRQRVDFNDLTVLTVDQLTAVHPCVRAQ